MGTDDRVRTALLAGLTVAALAAGGWWWRAAAPATGPVGARPSPSAAEPTEPIVGQVFQVDPSTGQVVSEALDGQAGPAPGETLISHVVWEDRSHLGAGDDPLVRQTDPSAGERFLLTVGCTGAGTLRVAWSGAEEDGPGLVTSCSSPRTTQPITAQGGPLQTRFTVSDGAVDLDARLVSLF
ncbi:hypothetical protein Q2K19_13000 [Micromonospora soli]|uniref:hypothetical protein n=1 Tax=Micromonospora sp. NBRC 110009 TaxID=3061627 RepID=UPI002673834A|nr:hypothetical protein [Micromonospora sp. NBRC 110009]WKU01314.1 hypothetical protein Q2K19_13000 [Micromonospora sp. NBRC 110009]